MKYTIALLVLVFSVSACTKETPSHIEYQISHHVQDSTAFLKIVMSFEPDSDGTTELSFQNKAWGQDSLHHVIGSMKLLEIEGEVKADPENHVIKLSHPAGLKNLNFEYTLQQVYRGAVTTRNDFRPIVQPHFFHVFSHNLFMLPMHILESTNDQFNLEVLWQNLPDSFTIANSFGTNKTKQFIEGISEQEFHSAIWTGGDFRVHTMEVQGNEVVFAIRGDWKNFNDEEMTGILEKTVKAQRDFWQDHSQPYFLVTMIPTFEKNGSSFHGTGLTDSFAVSASNNERLEVEGLVYLFNHELMHNWTGKVIKNENEEEQYWFSEGFTEYYAFKNIARNSIYGLDASYFLKEINRTVMELTASPVQTAPNNEINYDNFWSNRDYGKLPYYRGAFFAFYLDYKIKQDSNNKKSLDDLILKIKEEAVAHGQNLNHSFFIETANTFLQEDITPFFEQHILKGESMPIDKIYRNFEFEFHPTSEVFGLGFEISEDKKITHIDLTSNAYAAGLRNGDQLVSGTYGYDISELANFKIKKGGEEKEIAFYPAVASAIPSLKIEQELKLD